MNLSSLLPSWLKHGGKTVAPTKITAPEPPAAKVEVAPAPEPEISCFVKGIIRSMETEPEKWEEKGGDIYEVRYEHSSSGIALWRSNTCGPWTKLYVHGFRTTQEEDIALCNAYKTHVIEPQERKVKEEQDRKNAMIRAYFESIGCPPASTSENSTDSTNV